MRIGARNPESAYSAESSVAEPWRGLARDLIRCIVPINRGIELFAIQAGWYPAMVQS